MAADAGRRLGDAARWLKTTVSPSDSSTPHTAGRRENNWIDGLRGVASFLVFTGHLATSFAPFLRDPAVEDGGTILVFQYPFIRLLTSGGRGAVAIFFIISGYVNALGPIKHARGGNTQACLTNMSRSSFSRTFRLVFPGSCAILFTWFATQVGALRMGHRIDASWIQNGCNYFEPFWDSLFHLWNNLTVFWRTAHSHYDGVLWSLPWFLATAFRVYAQLLVMTFVNRRSWYLITAFCFWFAWISNDFLIGLNATFGVFLAQLHTDLGSRSTNLLPMPVPGLIMILGCFMWSFPIENHTWAPWSRIMGDVMKTIGPTEPEPISRYWSVLGIAVLMLGITFSRNAKSILTLPLFNFLGRCSFAVYLLHNTLARTVLVWMLYGYSYYTTPELDEEGNMIVLKAPGTLTFVFVMPVFYIITYSIAYLWTVYVDAFCVTMINKLKEWMFEDQEKSIPLASTAA